MNTAKATMEGQRTCCEVCDFFIARNSISKHIKSRGHLRREEFKNLECKWEELKRADDSGSAAVVAELQTILRKKMPDNTLLFHLGPTVWKDIRTEGPEEFRQLHLRDEMKSKMQAILDDLGARYSDTYPELKNTINMLRNVMVRTYPLHLFLAGAEREWVTRHTRKLFGQYQG
jgi:hypothetical protein